MAFSRLMPPKTYSDWASILDKLRNREDDQDVLEAMQQGTIAWQSGVAERFSQKLVDTINYRMNSATDRFQKEMSRSRGERETVQALIALRKELSFLAKAINLPAIPQETREQYRQLVVSQAKSIQSSLEDSAKRDRTGKMSSIVRNNRVDAI